MEGQDRGLNERHEQQGAELPAILIEEEKKGNYSSPDQLVHPLPEHPLSYDMIPDRLKADSLPLQVNGEIFRNQEMYMSHRQEFDR